MYYIVGYLVLELLTHQLLAQRPKLIGFIRPDGVFAQRLGPERCVDEEGAVVGYNIPKKKGLG